MWMTALLLAGCWGTEPRALEEERVRDEMTEHWKQGTAIRDAVVAGDLDDIHTQAAALSKRLPVEGIPARVEPIQDDLQKTVAALATTGDIVSASALVGQMALTCGRCHTEVDAKPYDDTPAPPAGTEVKEEMATHQWAVERMWLGLVRNDPSQFTEAVTALQEAPLVPSGTAADSPLPPLATELELGVHELAQSARSAPDQATRAKHYGELLVTCATCHALIRDKRR